MEPWKKIYRPREEDGGQEEDGDGKEEDEDDDDDGEIKRLVMENAHALVRVSFLVRATSKRKQKNGRHGACNFVSVFQGYR